jgi:hypothetical protein
MDQLFDDLARILATGHSRRKALRLLGGAFAAAVVGAFAAEPLSAQSQSGPCSPEQIKYGAATCGPPSDPNSICCTGGTCCAFGGQGQNGVHVRDCCDKGKCYCANGRCAGSANSPCPAGCTRC